VLEYLCIICKKYISLNQLWISAIQIQVFPNIFEKEAKMNTLKTNLCLIILASLVILISETSGQCTPYLGQAVPTTIVKRFPPSGFLANQQWFWHGTPMFSPDGNEMYFVKYFKDDSGTEICFSKCENGQWTTPQKASFSIRSTTYSDNNPFFTSSNDTLYFRSNRNNGFIHYVVRKIKQK